MDYFFVIGLLCLGFIIGYFAPSLFNTPISITEEMNKAELEEEIILRKQDAIRYEDEIKIEQRDRKLLEQANEDLQDLINELVGKINQLVEENANLKDSFKVLTEE